MLTNWYTQKTRSSKFRVILSFDVKHKRNYNYGYSTISNNTYFPQVNYFLRNNIHEDERN